ncbi:S-adenosyl-L-methionine-dependent methyltransferase [Atractiella rhizophila]|nr:S-adenosyl-L-methionine-dependent methyltransferase [Atractiella rhizophila]
MSEVPAAQYDNFGEAYARQNTVSPYNHFYERPGMMSAVLSVSIDKKPLRVLDLGCGSGALLKEIFAKLPVKEAVGIDASKFLLDEAKIQVEEEKCSFFCVDLAKPDCLSFLRGEFDLVVSSLTIHYIKDWVPLFKQIKALLATDGYFIFTTHHPTLDWCLATERYLDQNPAAKESFPSAMTFLLSDSFVPPISYHTEPQQPQLVVDRWWVGDVRFYRRSLTEQVRETIEGGLRIKNLVELRPGDEWEEDKFPKDRTKVGTRPWFILFTLT